MRVEEDAHRSLTNDMVQAAFAEIGVPRVSDYSGTDQFSAFCCRETIAGGATVLGGQYRIARSRLDGLSREAVRS